MLTVELAAQKLDELLGDEVDDLEFARLVELAVIHSAEGDADQGEVKVGKVDETYALMPRVEEPNASSALFQDGSFTQWIPSRER